MNALCTKFTLVIGKGSSRGGGSYVACILHM